MSKDTNYLLDRASALVEAAKRAGADACDTVVVRSRSTHVSVREGKVEDTDSSESNQLSLRVFCGKKVASVSSVASGNADHIAERAVAMARVSPEDPYNSLADEQDLAKTITELDLYDATERSAEQLRDDALELESAALDVKGVTKSSGAGASVGIGGMVLVTSHGFVGSYQGSSFSRSVSVIAGSGTAMERDYDFDSAKHFEDLRSVQDIGRVAGENVVKRLNPRKIPTQNLSIVLDPRVSRSLLGSLAGAINGSSIARKSSFLKDKMGEQIASSKVTVIDNPKRLRGARSCPFDGEGVSGESLVMVENGVLKHWFLSTSVGAELGLPTNGRGSRGGNTVSAGPTNLSFEPGDIPPQDLLKNVGTGLYVTETIGHGINMVTGEYSQGASGFWIENGEIKFPVSEVTLASNLKNMFMNMTLANDIDRSFSMAAPTIAIEGMTLAGT